HVAELLEERNRLCGDLSEASRKRFLRTLRGVIEEAAQRGEIDLPAAGLHAGQAAELFVDAAKGLEGAGARPQNPNRYERRGARQFRRGGEGLGGGGAVAEEPEPLQAACRQAGAAARGGARRAAAAPPSKLTVLI